jgi:hypothetical protein
LIDEPRPNEERQGRGWRKGHWSWAQRRLLFLLLDKRTEVTVFRDLFNIPVSLWLIYGDGYVPVRQLRRAMLSWCGSSRLSERRADRVARRVVSDVAHADSTRSARAKLASLLSSAMSGGEVHRDGLTYALRRVLDPATTNVPRGPRGAKVSPDSVYATIEAHLIAMICVADFSDEDLREARRRYRETRTSYERRWRRFQSDPDLGKIFMEPTAAQVVLSSCEDFISILGTLR